MINLLPPNTKSQLAAARANRLLLNYIVLLLAAIAFLLGAIGIVYIYLGNAKSTAEASIQDSMAQVSDYAAVESEASSFRQDLANAKQILDNDVVYSKVILEIASVLPPGIILDTLSLDSETFGTPTTLTAKARDYNTVLQLKDALQRTSLFSDASIQTISSGAEGAYPLNATLSVTIQKDAAR